MQLLVSVRSAAEALVAAAGGADIIDAKEPSAGALGPVPTAVFTEIRLSVRADQLVTAALGDADDATDNLAREFVSRGASLVKVGFAGVGDSRRIEEIIARAARACRSVTESSGVIAVAYADAAFGDGAHAMQLISIAARAGARGVLVDTAGKRGPGLTTLWSSAALASWVAEAHAHGLLAAVAGKLSAQDLPIVFDAGADVAGVRGAACEGGRSGRVSAERVKVLVTTASARTTETTTAGESAREKYGSTASSTSSTFAPGGLISTS
jgi:(5-formylfuran-3-yl)methyl phosphate synthase